MAETIITWEELEKHIYDYDCWILIKGYVYNISNFLVSHPGGDTILLKHSAIDATAEFEGLPHSDFAVGVRNSKIVGKISTPTLPDGYLQRLEKKKRELANDQKKKITVRKQRISLEEVSLHKAQQNCWIILEGKVYDCRDYLQQHPGGKAKIMQWAGKDATKAFKDVNHSMSAITKRNTLYIGDLQGKGALFYLILSIIFGVIAWVFLK